MSERGTPQPHVCTAACDPWDVLHYLCVPGVKGCAGNRHVPPCPVPRGRKRERTGRTGERH